MFIALVSDCYLPRLGGIEVQVADLAQHLRAAGHTVLVVTATSGPVQAGVCRLDPPVRLGLPVNPWAGSQLRSVLAKADVVHVHLGVLAPFAQMGAKAAVAAGLPVLVTWHSLVAGSPLTPVLARSWRTWVDAGVVPTAVSNLAAQQVSDVLEAPVAVLRNGLNLARWRPRPDCAAYPDPAEHRGARQPIQVISAMRFAARKRPLRLISMMSAVRKTLPDQAGVQLTILGDGPWLEPLRQLVARSSLRSWVDLPGRVSREGLVHRYRHSDLYVAPARQEAFGIAALEARTAGLPVAAFAGSGLADVVEHGLGGVLATDDADMVSEVSALLSNPQRLRDMATHHREHLMGAHDWTAVTEATLHIYRRIRVSRAR